MVDRNKFKFIFFVTFPSEDQVIGLKLCEGLNEMQKQEKHPMFEFHLILSTFAEYKRWDAMSIEHILDPYKKQISKIWVCGPPKMNEDFDRIMPELSPKLKI